MNSLEAGRQRAERLHAEAVSAGHDPRNSYEFARAEAAKRLIDVERVPKGDIRLHGGRALYDPDALLILREDSDDTFLDAFLVAHELGHIELGGQTEAMAVTDADPLRAAEAVPIGVERVVDYSRRQRREVQMDLFAREFLLGIPVLYLGSLFERDEIKELLSVLLLIVDRRAMGLVRVAAADRWAVPLGDVASVLWHLKDQDGLPLAWVTDLDGVPGLTEEGREGLRLIALLADGFSINANPWDVLASVLLDRSRIAAEIAESSAVNARTQGIAIWQLMSFTRTQPPAKGLPITRLLERIRRMVQHGDEKDLRQLPTSAQGIDAVRLMTMHGSKGLEFDVVHIPGMVNGSLPRSPKSDLARSIIPPDGLIEGGGGKSLDALMASISEEHECLFFVAMSRARDRLLLYSPTEKSGGAKWPRSSFIDRLGGTIAESRISTFTAGETDVVLDRTPIAGEPNGVSWGGYAGLSLRLVPALRQWQFSDSEGPVTEVTKQARWIAFSGPTQDGRSAAIVVLDHPQSFRHPTPWYLIQGMPYFSPAVLYRNPHTLPAKESLTLKYRMLFQPAAANRDAIEKEWQAFASER